MLARRVVRGAGARLERAARAAAGSPWLAWHYARCVPPWLLARRQLRDRILTEDELRARRRGDTVFVFGSGASLNAISAEEWEAIARHDTFGFNWFVLQDFVRCDFHLIRQIADSNRRTVWEPQTREYFEALSSSPHYRDAVLLVQHELRARGVNLAFRLGVFPDTHPVFPFRTSRARLPAERFDEGLVHGSSTLLDAVNAASLIGWTSIVLVGVDLYDRRYFWLPEDETRALDRLRGASASDTHSQAATGLIETLGEWRTALRTRGVELSVYNPESLLARELPVYAW